MRVDVLIQHHPSRADLLPPLLEAVPAARVIEDPDPYPPTLSSPWRVYRLCLEEAEASGATHALVLQDDSRVCQYFPEALDMAVAARPENPIALFHGGQPRENILKINAALKAGSAFAPLSSRRWVPVVALVWPVALIQPSLDFVDAQNWPSAFRADDEIVGRCLRHVGASVVATVPSLVEHDDVVPSTIGRRARGGLDRGRVAHMFIGDGDPRILPWNA